MALEGCAPHPLGGSGAASSVGRVECPKGGSSGLGIGWLGKMRLGSYGCRTSRKGVSH